MVIDVVVLIVVFMILLATIGVAVRFRRRPK